MEKQEILDLIELAYLRCLSEEGIVSDSLIISENIFNKVNSRNFLTLKIYYTDVFNDDDFLVCNMGLMIGVLEFNCDTNGKLDCKIAEALKKHIYK